MNQVLSRRKPICSWQSVGLGLAVLLIWLPCLAQAQVQGTVVNETTGRPAGRVAVTLIKFDGGMAPVEEVYTEADGTFQFEKSLTGSGGQGVPGMVRAEFEGVSYSKMIPPGTSAGDVRVAVYSSVEAGANAAPQAHIIIFEPGRGEMVVNHTFLFNNGSVPPTTFRDPQRGTLRFHLPPEAKDIVQVSGSGPAGMPLRSTATKTDEHDVFMVDFPIKPGENSIRVTYLVPHEDGATFAGRMLYPGLRTRFVAPAGVSFEGDTLLSMGQEPTTQASIYETSSDQTFTLAIRGEGRLSSASGAGGSSGGGGGGELRVAPAPIREELIWILALTCAILGVGFYHLLTSNAEPSPGGAVGAQSAGAHPKADRAKGSPSSPRRRKR